MANRPANQAPETSSELAISARNAGLHYVTDRRPGIVRARKRGGAFDYFDPHGRRIRETKSLERIKRLAIPPAWRDVWICPDASGHLQATGRDARGRKQYRYHSGLAKNPRRDQVRSRDRLWPGFTKDSPTGRTRSRPPRIAAREGSCDHRPIAGDDADSRRQ